MPPQSASPDASTPPPDERPLVYVVDDETLLLDLAKVILQPLGLRVETFTDPASALRAYRAAKTPPELIITDYSMGNTTGALLLEGSRETYPLQKVLLISGTVQQRVFDETKVRPNAFLAKPYQAAQLVEIVKSLLKD